METTQMAFGALLGSCTLASLQRFAPEHAQCHLAVAVEPRAHRHLSERRANIGAVCARERAAAMERAAGHARGGVQHEVVGKAGAPLDAAARVHGGMVWARFRRECRGRGRRQGDEERRHRIGVYPQRIHPLRTHPSAETDEYISGYCRII